MFNLSILFQEIYQNIFKIVSAHVYKGKGAKRWWS